MKNKGFAHGRVKLKLLETNDPAKKCCAKAGLREYPAHPGSHHTHALMANILMSMSSGSLHLGMPDERAAKNVRKCEQRIVICCQRKECWQRNEKQVRGLLSALTRSPSVFLLQCAVVEAGPCAATCAVCHHSAAPMSVTKIVV